VVGVANVLLGIPVWVSALHLGNAALMLSLSIVGTHRLAGMTAAARGFAAAGAPRQAKRTA
jgi:heme A synthase